MGPKSDPLSSTFTVLHTALREATYTTCEDPRKKTQPACRLDLACCPQHVGLHEESTQKLLVVFPLDNV